jgi:hypothetical protein
MDADCLRAQDDYGQRLKGWFRSLAAPLRCMQHFVLEAMTCTADWRLSLVDTTAFERSRWRGGRYA